MLLSCLTSLTFICRVWAAASPELHSHSGNPLSRLDLPDDEYGATVFALLYGTPAPAFSSAFGGAAGLSALGTNNVFSLGRLSRAGDNTVVRPNVDTIYGITVMDITQSDLVLTVPPMQPDRYTLFAFYDIWGDNYASIGGVDWDLPGDYLIRPSIKDAHSGKSTCEGYSGCVNAPALNGILLTRVEVKNSSDVKYVNQYIGQVKVKEIRNREPLGPKLVPNDLRGTSKDMPTQALQLTARLAARNQPQNPLFATMLPWVLRTAGIRDGEFHPIGKVNLTKAYNEWKRILNNFYADPKNSVPLNNGWSYLNPIFLGSYQHGKNVVARSFVSQFGYLANTADQAIYPAAPKEIYTLPRGGSYVVGFSGKPPVNHRVGFWSLTMYDANGFLIKNAEHVYALGDRSNLTYPDGRLLYGPGADESDGPFEILVQAADDAPPKNWTSNWLPGPPGGGDFQITLRLYGPAPGATGGYEYPTVSKREAIR